MAVISLNTVLAYAVGDGAEFIEIENLQETPSLGGSVESIDITTLKDPAYCYTKGIKSYGDSLEFKVLYDKETFQELNELDGENTWKVTLADMATCTFKATSAVSLDGVGVNAALTFTLALQPCSEMVWA